MFVRPTLARVDEAALRHNVRLMQVASGHGRVLAVVKADAYGHGATRIARVCLDAGVWGLAVSLVEEGAALRDAGIPGPILVLGGIYPGHEDLALLHRLTPVVWETNQVERLGAAVRRFPSHGPVRVHLQVDTGMGRLGCLPTELSGVVDALRAARPAVAVEGVMTHFACADEEVDEASPRQLACFEAALASVVAAGIDPAVVHAANSAATLRYSAARFDMVRPGLALYGVKPGGVSGPFDGRPALSVVSRIVGLRHLPAGHGVSYGHLVKLTRPSQVAIVPVGYEDGYPRRASGRASVLVRGERCAVLGRVTMDMLVVDVTTLPAVELGDVVTLIGRDGDEGIDVAEIAGWADLSTYELLCGLSSRVPRV